jgi:hypothetical protein
MSVHQFDTFWKNAITLMIFSGSYNRKAKRILSHYLVKHEDNMFVIICEKATKPKQVDTFITVLTSDIYSRQSWAVQLSSHVELLNKKIAKRERKILHDKNQEIAINKKAKKPNAIKDEKAKRHVELLEEHQRIKAEKEAKRVKRRTQKENARLNPSPNRQAYIDIIRKDFNRQQKAAREKRLEEERQKALK